MASRLGADDVIEMAVLFLDGDVSLSDLARRWGVDRVTVRRALEGYNEYAQYQRYLPVEKIQTMLAYRRKVRSPKLDPQDVVELRERWTRGMQTKDLARCYGITLRQVNYIVRGKCFAFLGGPVYNPRAESRL